MNLQQLRYARAIAECGSFVEAAARCAVTQPTLSNGLAQLEKELGQRLFDRTTRRVQLTDFGLQILPNIIDVLAAHETVLAKARNLSHPARHLIRIGVSPILGVKLVDTIVEPFRRANTDVDVIFREMNLAELTRMLELDQLECVFGPVDSEFTPHSQWNSVLLYKEPLIFIANGQTGRGMARNSFIQFTDIEKETFVMVPDTCGLAQTTRAAFRRHRLQLKEYAGEAMSYRVLQEWATLGIGAAILPRSKVSDEIGAQIVGEDGLTLNIAYYSIWRTRATQRSDLKRFATYLEEAAHSIAVGLHNFGGNLATKTQTVGPVSSRQYDQE